MFSKGKKLILSLPKCEDSLKSDILSIGHIKFFELRREWYSEISPVPWLDLISIDILSILITLMPSVFIGMSLEPGDIAAVLRIFIIFFLGRRIEYIDRETELMFTISRGSTESRITFSEIPHSLLVLSAPISTNHDERFTEFFIKCLSNKSEGIMGLLSKFTFSSSFFYVSEIFDPEKIRRDIALIRESYISTREHIDICIFTLRE